MKIIGILLIALGVIGLALGMAMFGDIGLAAMIGATSALLSGVGFILTARQLKTAKKG